MYVASLVALCRPLPPMPKYTPQHTHRPIYLLTAITTRGLGSVLDSGAEGPGFKSQSRRCRVTVLGKTAHTHCASVHQATKLVAVL